MSLVCHGAGSVVEGGAFTVTDTGGEVDCAPSSSTATAVNVYVPAGTLDHFAEKGAADTVPMTVVVRQEINARDRPVRIARVRAERDRRR